MQKYQITFDVPDDFVPEELALTASYGKGEGEISIAEEGYIEHDVEVVAEAWEEMKQLIQDKIQFNVDSVPENSVVRVMFPIEACDDPESLVMLKDAIESTYKLPCVCICGDIELMIENANDAIKLLEGMIAKIKTRAAVKDTSGIVLPN